jgi:hypothetical protein
VESVPHQVSIEAVPGATEVPARRLQQRIMGAHEAIGVGFDAQDRRHVATLAKEPMPQVRRQANRPAPHTPVRQGAQAPS